jgi:uncharacterized membrane protein YsdA (DUF1294 family)
MNDHSNTIWVIILAAYLGIINIVAFHVYTGDKLAAVRGQWRTSEKRLLTLTALGGTLGALLSRWFMHHKTKKMPFRLWFWLIVLGQIAAITAFFSFKRLA